MGYAHQTKEDLRVLSACDTPPYHFLMLPFNTSTFVSRSSLMMYAPSRFDLYSRATSEEADGVSIPNYCVHPNAENLTSDLMFRLLLPD